MSYNAKSLANLKPGYKGTIAQAKALAKRMNDAKRTAHVARKEAAILARFGELGLIAYRLGRREGYNVGYLRWKAYAEQRVQEAYRRVS